jgi:hypothetical protein
VTLRRSHGQHGAGLSAQGYLFRDDHLAGRLGGKHGKSGPWIQDPGIDNSLNWLNCGIRVSSMELASRYLELRTDVAFAEAGILGPVVWVVFMGRKQLEKSANVRGGCR